MTKLELKQCMEIAKSEKQLNYDNILLFDGYALNGFKAVYTTIDEVAALIRWQCYLFNGQMDMIEFNILSQIAKHKFLIV